MRWLEPEPLPAPAELVQAVGGHPLVAATLARRGLSTPGAARAFLDPDAYTPTPASALPDLDAAVERLARALDRGERILVWGDFDVDGQTATTVLVEGLRRLGAQVAYNIPVRAEDSHGITLPKLQAWLQEGIDLLLTCDTGVAEHAAVDLARSRGTDVILTDHHELPPTLPDALAVINPNRLADGHPLRNLPGVGVAYKLIEGLYAQQGRAGEETRFLDLVALGIVADVAIQRADTRYLLQRGLLALRSSERLGLQLLAEQAGLNLAGLTEEDIGFALAPRMNALGRLGDANPMVDFLTTADRTRAAVLAARLEALNSRRKLDQAQILEAARARLERDPGLLDPHVLVLEHPEWPGGIIGLVAGQLARELGKPVILLHTGDGAARGSARSMEGVHITEVLARCAHLLDGFGGHAGAAGLSLPLENLPALRRELDRAVREVVGEDLPEPTLGIDAILDWSEPDLALAGDLARLGPFGSGNPPLTLASRGLRIVQRTQLGRSGDHLKLTLEDPQGVRQEVLHWFSGSTTPPEGILDLAYQLSIHTFRGEQQARLTWVAARPSQLAGVVQRPRKREVLDLRDSANPQAALAAVQAEHPDAVVFAEGLGAKPQGSGHRQEIGPAADLVLWSPPPSPAVLHNILSRAEPQRVHLLLVPEDPLDVSGLLQQLAGLARFAIRTGRTTTLPELAAVLGVTEPTVAQGLSWLERKGMVSVEEVYEEIRLREGPGTKTGDVPAAETTLQALLEEQRAFQRFLGKAPAADIVSV